MTKPSNPGGGSTQSVVMSYLKERKGRFILKGKGEVFFFQSEIREVLFYRLTSLHAESFTGNTIIWVSKM